MAEGNGRSWSPEVKELGDKIVALTIGKAVELRDYLKETYKIEPAGGGVVMAAPAGGGGGGGEAKKAEEPTAFNVILEGFDAAKKIGVIKEIRAITNLGLKEAKDLVEGAPKPVKENVDKAEAEKIKAQLEAGGGKVAIKPVA
jgi:large subunit ribosomal protein L7/L12